MSDTTDQKFSFEFKGEQFVLRPLEMDGHMDQIVRAATGHPMMWWFTKSEDPTDLGIEGIGVFVWAARYQRGEHNLKVRDVTKSLRYSDLATFSEVEVEGEDNAEGEA